MTTISRPIIREFFKRELNCKNRTRVNFNFITTYNKILYKDTVVRYLKKIL